MNILINGVGFHNKGAELMFRAIVEHFRDNPQVTKLAVTFPCSDKQLSLYAPCKHFESQHDPDSFNFDMTDAVIDASGFAFGDQWDPGYVKDLCKRLIKFANAGKKVILLPQAFGPFLREEIRPLCKELFTKAKLIFPRDRISVEFVNALMHDRKNVCQAPDFTNLVEGRLPIGFNVTSPWVCVLPNTRMLDRTNSETAQTYISFLEHAITEVKNKGIDLHMIFHEPGDCKVALRCLMKSGHGGGGKAELYFSSKGACPNGKTQELQQGI